MSQEKPEGKPPSESAMTTVRVMMPTDGNIVGNVFGGSIMKYMDEIAGIVAFKHARRLVVTASIDRMNFWEPVFVGNLLILRSSVNYVGRTSMEVGVRIEAEDLVSGKVSHTGSCYLTFVTLDDHGRPAPATPLLPTTPDEKRRWKEAVERRRLRDAEREAEKSEEGSSG
jgi:acyl-CoA hydrolase